jgi:hypothetical protein
VEHVVLQADWDRPHHGGSQWIGPLVLALGTEQAPIGDLAIQKITFSLLWL